MRRRRATVRSRRCSLCRPPSLCKSSWVASPTAAAATARGPARLRMRQCPAHTGVSRSGGQPCQWGASRWALCLPQAPASKTSRRCWKVRQPASLCCLSARLTPVGRAGHRRAAHPAQDALHAAPVQDGPVAVRRRRPDGPPHIRAAARQRTAAGESPLPSCAGWAPG